MDSYFFDEDALYRWEFKNKAYPHFDSEFCRRRVDELITTYEKTECISNKFYPFIRFKIPKYRKDENGRIYNDDEKPRYIMHTARVDSNVYSFFRNILMNKYESLIKNLGISECVIAYRKIPISPGDKKGKCNIHFANEVIDEILNRSSNLGECAAIAMDISGFFDNLCHDLIKRQWCRVMEFEHGLTRDHYSIFKNITKYRYIDSNKLEEILEINWKILKKSKEKQICCPNIFREKVLPNLSEKNKIGIPQGTAISDVIANMYMLDFDVLMKKFADKYHGYYRRYSDDILFICPIAHQDKAIKFILWLIGRAGGGSLKISNKKTLISHFKSIEGGSQCITYKNINGTFRVIAKPFEYLGLSFDGVTKRIRQSTISSFYGKLSGRIKKEVEIAYNKLKEKGKVFPTEDEIFKTINFNMIRNSYMENRDNFSKRSRKFLGNFFTYVQLVARVTNNSSVLEIFNHLGAWIKKRARKYCKDILKKNELVL